MPSGGWDGSHHAKRQRETHTCRAVEHTGSPGLRVLVPDREANDISNRLGTLLGHTSGQTRGGDASRLGADDVAANTVATGNRVFQQKLRDLCALPASRHSCDDNDGVMLDHIDDLGGR